MMEAGKKHGECSADQAQTRAVAARFIRFPQVDGKSVPVARRLRRVTLHKTATTISGDKAKETR
jgi:hypothetical protein